MNELDLVEEQLRSWLDVRRFRNITISFRTFSYDPNAVHSQAHHKEFLNLRQILSFYRNSNKKIFSIVTKFSLEFSKSFFFLAKFLRNRIPQIGIIFCVDFLKSFVCLWRPRALMPLSVYSILPKYMCPCLHVIPVNGRKATMQIFPTITL